MLLGDFVAALTNVDSHGHYVFSETHQSFSYTRQDLLNLASA
jgi:hypothetical protein